MSRKVKTKVGFPGNIKEIEVTVDDNDPDPWGADAKLAVVGTNVPRVDGPVKVTGRAKYTYDIAPKGVLYGKILRSPHGAAEIKSIDVSAAYLASRARTRIEAPNAPMRLSFMMVSRCSFVHPPPIPSASPRGGPYRPGSTPPGRSPFRPAPRARPRPGARRG